MVWAILGGSAIPRQPLAGLEQAQKKSAVPRLGKIGKNVFW